MAGFETLLLVVLIVLVIYLIIRIRQSGEGKIEPKTFGEIMSKVTELKTLFEEREKKHEKIEKQRDEFLKHSNELLSKELTNFTRLLSGTKKGGIVGESMLKEILHPFIKSGKVITDLHVDNKVVEFAWKVTNSKFVPIDSKFPDVINSYKTFCESKDKKEQLKHKKGIIDKLKKEIQNAKKYKNKKNTTNRVIIAIPDAIFELIPEINSDFESTGVIVAGYRFVTYIAAHIEREYQIIIESGEVGDYKELLNIIRSLIHDIKKKTESIDKGVVIIKNANDDIKKYSIEAEANKPKKKKKIVLENK